MAGTGRISATGVRRLADLDEATVVSRAQDGDLKAFEVLVDSYQGPLYRYVVRTVSDRPLAEDIVQETLIAAWRKLPTLTTPAAFRGWLFQIATFRALDALRRRRAERTLLDGSLHTSPVLGQVPIATGHDADPAVQAEQHSRLWALQQVLASLPTSQRQCWVLKDLEGFSYEEIATALNLPVSTVRGRLARARARISERMAAWR